MKTPNIHSSELSAGRRAQPPRQTRNNPPRSAVPGSRAFGPRGSLGGLDSPPSLDQPVEIFPAITHFADAITALPKELVRHFTLLKEVDAKIFAPEEDLAKLVDAALNAPPPERRHALEAHHALGPTSTPMSTQGSVNGSVNTGHVGSVASVPDDVYNPVSTAYDSANIPRRQLFQHCAYTMQNMLVSLDEKNHVISTAAEALNKQLARIDDCFPYIELEVSDEARYGSVTHWAYPENRATKLSSGGSRRGDLAAASTLTAAAQHLVDEAAARSDARKQALLAKRNNKHQTESDFDDPHERHKEPSKKLHGNSKIRKAADASLGIGLGITNGAGTNGNPPKRRKVEKGPTGGAVMERALSSVFGSNGTVTKGKGGSPRETPGPEGSKKRSRAAASTNGQTGRKRYVIVRYLFGVKTKVLSIRNNTVTSVAMSPSLASSPIRTTFPESKLTGRMSPAPTNGGQPASSRARQNSTQSVVEPARQSSVRTNGVNTPDLRPAAEATGRTIAEVKLTMKETATNSKEHLLEDVDKEDAEMVGGIVVGNRKDSIMKREDTETNGDAMQDIQITTVTTKSGRASKPSTPAIPQFPEPVRSRSSRNALEAASINKRSHKKGAGAAAQQQLLAQQNSELDDGASDMQGDEEDGELADEDADPDEPRYCYCNSVSYGEMVGCDAENCEREWFHLPCVGLKVAPKGNGELPFLFQLVSYPVTDFLQPNGIATIAKRSSKLSALMADKPIFIEEIMTRNLAEAWDMGRYDE
jgi:hypothetical protein